MNVRRIEFRTMNKEQKISALVYFVQSLSGFRIIDEIDGNYNHMGATIADAILQANMKYESHVRPRVNRIRTEYPEAATISGLRRLLSEITITEFLDWRGMDRTKRFKEVVDLLSNQGVNTERDFKKWLTIGNNLLKLREIHGIGPKTVDYFRLLTGFQTNAVDRHLLNFLKKAGIDVSGYDEAQDVINLAADKMSIARSHFDHSIWTYMSTSHSACEKKCH